jgi:hypothetical protein
MSTKIALVHSCLRMVGALALCGESAAAAVRAALLGREEDGTRAVNSFGNLWQIIQLYAAQPAFRGSAALLCGELVEGLSTARTSVGQSDASAAVLSLREDDAEIDSILREAKQIAAAARPSDPLPAQRTKADCCWIVGSKETEGSRVTVSSPPPPPPPPLSPIHCSLHDEEGRGRRKGERSQADKRGEKRRGGQKQGQQHVLLPLVSPSAPLRRQAETIGTHRNITIGTCSYV